MFIVGMVPTMRANQYSTVSDDPHFAPLLGSKKGGTNLNTSSADLSEIVQEGPDSMLIKYGSTVADEEVNYAWLTPPSDMSKAFKLVNVSVGP